MVDKVNLRHPLITAGALFLIILVLSLAVFRLTYTSFPLPTPITALDSGVLAPTISPTVVQTQTSTSTIETRPSLTIRPSSTTTITPTATATSTPAPRATLTAAGPSRFNELYLLREWSPSQADLTIQQLNPDSLYPTDQDRLKPEYQQAFSLATLAQKEALHRFPDSPYASSWKWGLAYNLAHLNDPQAGNSYADLIADALNQRQTSLEQLPEWFSRQEHRLELNIIDLPPFPGYLSNQILEIKGNGAAHIWLLESPAGFQAYALDSNFDFTQNIRPNHLLADLNGDGVPEFISYTSPPTGTSDIVPPHVFDLSKVPPSQFRFLPTLPYRFRTNFPMEWKVIEDTAGNKQLLFEATLFPFCPVVASRTYSRQGDEFVAGDLQFQVHPVTEYLEYCEMVVDHSSLSWGPEITAQIMETILPQWPPPQNLEGNPYPPSARDEWLYRLGIQHALAGHPEQDRDYLNSVVMNPSSLDSPWIKLAQEFLDVYQSPADLYTACLTSDYCDSQVALERVISTIPLADYDLIPTYLEDFGIQVRSSGIFDFENDGEPERWIAVQHKPGERLEFWILPRTLENIQAVFVDMTDSGNPSPHFNGPIEEKPIVQIKQREGFILERHPVTREPFITRVGVEFRPTTYTLDTMQKASDQLFIGNNPALALSTLTTLLKSGKFNCINYQFCDRMYYLLGLVYELNGQEREAINWYLKLWREYRDSPLAVLARMKLMTPPTITPTPSNTSTATSTFTITPTLNPNATLSVTSTATSTNTPSTPYP